MNDRTRRRAPSAGRRAALTAAALLASACAADQVRYVSDATLPESSEPAAAVLYLVGDAGEANAARAAVLEHLRQNADSVARSAGRPSILIAFLGDNIYEQGAPADPTSEDLSRLSGQVFAVPALDNVRGVFVPGNHDWGNGGGYAEGLAAVARQRTWIETMSEGRNVSQGPADGCPGPTIVDLGSAARVMLVDTEWLLRGTPDARCGPEADFYVRMAEGLRSGGDRPVVVLAHHPLVSGGPHGGNVGVRESPPVLYYLASQGGALLQDLGSSAYTAMRRKIAEAIVASGAPPLFQAAGHEHTLQVVRMGGDDAPRYQLVSGSASRSSPVRRIAGTRYASDMHGYMRVDFRTGGADVVAFGSTTPGSPLRPVFACTISRAAPPAECPEAARARE